MKNRLIILVSSIIFIFLMFTVSFFYGATNLQRIFLAVSLIALTFLSIYIFFGIGKLVTSLMYGIVLAVLLAIFPKYDMALIFIVTFVFALNPLHEFEQNIDKNLPEEKSIIDYLKGSYKPYYDYRKEIKSHYHLPQVKKIYTKPGYLKLRQAITVILAMLAIFLLIREVNNLINLLKRFDIHLFFASTYSVIIILAITVMLYKKGFQSAFNFLTVSVFPPIAYSLFLVKPLFLGLILGFIAIITGIALGIYQYLAYRSRIVYEALHYYDNDKQVEVFANALFEPHVYDENFRLSTTFKIDVDLNEFNKVFHSIVVYADLKRFFITAYTYRKNNLTIYTDFHHKDYQNIDKFKLFLEELFDQVIIIKVTEDNEKTFYQDNFFHKDDYIVARAVYLARMLKKLEIKSNVIISFMVYFENYQQLLNFSKKYEVVRLPEFDLENVFTARISFNVRNVDYIIENQVREFLLDLLISRGKYIRISVFY